MDISRKLQLSAGPHDVGGPDAGVRYGSGMKLEQGQTWTRGDTLIRLVRLERMAVTYKIISDSESGEGTHHRATKKEFCRLIKTLPPAATPEVPTTAAVSTDPRRLQK